MHTFIGKRRFMTPKELAESVNRRRTDNTIKGQRTIFKHYTER